MNNIIVLIIIIISSIQLLGVTCCDPAEIGQNYSLSWSGDATQVHVIYWFTMDYFITMCEVDTLTCGTGLRFFTANVTKTQNNVILTYITFLVSDIYQRPYSIEAGYNRYNVCDLLEVFNRSVSVNCTSNIESSVYKFVTIDCVSSNVFPRAKITVGLHTYKTTDDCQKDTDVQPYVARCVSIIPLRFFTLEANNISVKIFPNVTQGERYSLQYFYIIILELPKVDVTDCPIGLKDGYIKNGTSTSCLCVLSSPGYPPGQAQWYQKNNSSLMEVGTNEVNGSAHITINADQNSDNLNFACQGKSVLGRSIEKFNFSVKVVYPVEITRFTANANTSSIVVPEKSRVIFMCDVNINTRVSVAIIKRSHTSVINTSTVVFCEDSGEYVCQATELIFGATQERSITLFVQCALYLKNTESEHYVYKAIVKSDLLLRIEIYGYPPPSSYALLRRGPGNRDDSVSNITTQDKNKYLFDYSMQAIAYGNLYMTIFNVTLVDFTNYTLTISNGWGSELVYRFSITEDSTSTSDVLSAAIGGCVAGIVLIALIILLVIKRKDMRKIKSVNCTKRHGNEDENTVEIPKAPAVTVPQRTQDTGYEEVNLEQNYDRLDQNEGGTDQGFRYQQVNATRQYDEIDLSQVAIERPYDPVTTKEKGTYQNYALITSHI